MDNSTIFLQVGTNKAASQKGMSVWTWAARVRAAPTEPVIHNGSQGTGTSGSEISDFQAEYSDEYHGQYQDDYPEITSITKALIIRFTEELSI